MLNQQIGPYKIISKLGEGGMANVYLAEKGSLQKKVALKVLKDEFLSNQHIRNRFLSEAKKMSGLNHANIVGVHDLIDETNFVAIELDYVEGKTLRQHLQEKGALSDVEIEALFKQMLDALAYIHEKGFVHRDVKPSNFMLTDNGIIKLTDFGIAKNVDDSNMDYTGTGTGMQMGTPKYMSPEQVRSTKDVDHRTDIYSLGVVLWEMVTGKVPYDIQTSSTFDVFTKIVNEPLEKTNTRWDDIIEKTTRKEPINRYSSVGEVVFVDGERKTDHNSSTNEDGSAAKVEKEQILKDSEGSRIGENEENKDQLPFLRRKSTKILIALIFGASFLIYFAHQKDLERKEFLEFQKQMKIEKEERNENSGIFKDSRDGKTYKWVKIGEQIWMAENLAYQSSTGIYWMYEGDLFNDSKFGYLYDWEAACEVCPDGWKLPVESEWNELINHVGGKAIAGKKLKTTMGWVDDGNGDDEFGFSALPSGSINAPGGPIVGIGVYARFWGIIQKGNSRDKTFQSGAIFLPSFKIEIYLASGNGGTWNSVRCIKNN